MRSRKRVLLSTTMVPLMVAAGVAIIGVTAASVVRENPAAAQCAPKKVNPCNPCNPCAAKAANPCNPCNPCAAKAANPCNPCNPCAAGGGSASNACAVPRLQAAAKANPCAVAKPNPCNPCAAKNPCNPCAAKNPCNPCAAANPCNPCAAVNPCNPCAAGNPCNPCGAAGPVELTDAEAVKVYDCLAKELKAAYAKSDNQVAVTYASFGRYSRQPYVSGTHGNRYVQNFANDTGRAYGNYEKAGAMPAGTALAKDSFAVAADGQVSIGPLFVMEKMNAGFNAESGDWRYTMIMPDGAVFGTTKGAGADKVAFCIGCHISVAPDADSMMFLPEEYRVSR